MCGGETSSGLLSGLASMVGSRRGWMLSGRVVKERDAGIIAKKRRLRLGESVRCVRQCHYAKRC